jgi:hypothetical protein
MPVKRRTAKARVGEISLMERWDLQLGPSGEFASEEERREAWLRHRDSLMVMNAGHRPWAWWEYESAEPRNPSVEESLQLYRMGALREDELAELTAFWKETDQRARAYPSFVRGPGDVLNGRAAYDAWRRWAGIPDELLPPRFP